MEDLDPSEQLLHDARNGNLLGIQKLLLSSLKEEFKLNINCIGKSKSNFGWAPLHLACYFGHQNVVEELLKVGADVNLPNNVGDTPLHKAAFTGRKEVVMLLLQYNACATVLNGTAQIPKDVTNNEEIKIMLEAAERTEERKLEEQFLEAAREGDLATLVQLLNRKKPPNINCTDLLGNTALHCAAYRGQKHCALKLLKSGASTAARNKKDQTPLDLASDAEMRQILQGSGQRGAARNVPMYQGPLWKSSRFIGWRLYWVVLQDGVLSWFPKQSDAAANVRRQGCKALTQARCTVRERDPCLFTLKCFDDSIHHFKVDPKNDPQATRKRWLDAMEDHSAYSTHYCSHEQESEDDEDHAVTLAELSESLQSAQACHQRLESEVSALQAMVRKDERAHHLPPQVLQKVKETCALSGEVCAALRYCLTLFSQHEGVRSQKLEHEVEKNKILSEALQTLATEHHELEQSVVKGSSPQSALSEDEFYDAISESDSEHSLSGFETVASHSFEEDEEEEQEKERRVRPTGGRRFPASMSREDEEVPLELQANGIGRHRTSLPAPMFSRNDFSIWSILRKCIGMELSKITMPVIFNEPLSFLQRLTEYMEHTYLIHRANSASDSIERMKCVAAFAVSAVASQWERTGKPFNPLLGETYELVREDLGFRLISEQVSHHPPVSAFYAEGLKNDFVFHGSIYPKLKFWGKSVEAEPKGIITLELPKYGEAYTWTNPTCCVHNIIVGQLWIEQYGNVEVINHKSGEKCCLSFKPCGLFGKELHKVEGYILDKSKKKLCALYGKWTECLYTLDPAAYDTHKKNDRKNAEEKKGKHGSGAEEIEEMPLPDVETVEMIPGSQLLWRIAPRPPNSTEMYSFTLFAMQLNELDKDMEGVIPKTDCRLRPDIRAMENGDIDLASEEKKRLEEKQRAARKVRSKSDEDWKTRSAPLGPRWFNQAPNPHNGAQDWIFSGGYWDRNYSGLPDIY
uniref:Oxysterol-binding protein n=1 Tax=Paramormyrops kingsleyae TaxID=1676925 RepID=A0A3B3TC75_9TELE|nr:oxysterol-binding protein-related protein 1-like isoform X1 [Paramormyrops kingsleyae]XP_023682532.1 oxysterol-binding protein-related protein 1-like isoform X1 [Paramormyrops kingsleyae]XP_023682533.1 oxysterol-binding protein-related protein 1-like isoform X1 [Paramormyrops kingsleyae]XP_023682534.1 oxysterol-binding protein-related protein 1-like isoform X1 [Paramormyrops kingsleyae]XP_023682535.1 oxysterol-binding protein-related protein 1-like isoform X1 [Paramormyrops kingsleyae]XP_02